MRMNELDPWSTFFQSGSVLDYLNYKSYEYANKAAISGEAQDFEDTDEDFYNRPDYKRAEYS